MPLPEQDILQQGDVLAAQRNPGFETEALPSPAGFEAPEIAPIPIPGTGLVESGGQAQEAYLSKFNRSILGTRDRVTPGDLPNYSVSDVYNPRYRSILPGEDSEEAFAKAQPWFKQWGNAIAKMSATAAGTFVNGIMAIPDGISGNPYNTTMGNSIDTWLKNLEDTFPNYYTKWQQDHPFMSALPFSGGFSNFWGDKFLKNIGFTIGAIGSAVAQDAAIGLATGGIGEIPMIGSQIGKASLWLNKIFTGTNKADQLLQLGRATGRTGEQLIDLKNLAQAAAGTKVVNGARYAMNLYGSAASEAGFEARDAYNTIRDDLMKDFQKEKGYSATGKDLENIERYAKAAGNVRFGANLALLSISNALQFDAFMKPFSAAKAGFRSSIERDISTKSMIGLKQGSVDAFENIPKSMWGKIRPFVPAVLAEGVFEEGGQYATQIAVENFYERKYLYDKGLAKSSYSKDETPFDARDQVKNVVHSVVQGLKDEFSTDEGLENVLLGSLTGVVFAGGERVMDRLFNKDSDAKLTHATLSLLNSQGVTGILQNHYDNAAAAHRITEDMKQAVKDNDLFKYKNFQHEQFVKFITSGVKAGRFDVRMEQLKMLKEMDNEEFKKAFGLDKTNDNVKTADEYVDVLIQKAQKIKKSYDLINDTFTNPFRNNPKDSTPEGAEEALKHNTFEGWKDDLAFLASINSDVDARLDSIGRDLRTINPNLDHYHVANFTDRKYLKNYANSLEQEVKGLQGLVDQKASADPNADKNRIKSLQAKVQLINNYLTDPNFSEKRFEGTFKNLLQFHLNGQQDVGNVQIPQEALPKLIEYGRDVQRLRQYRDSANKAFDKLSTEEGFNRYFREAFNAQSKYSEQAPPVSPTPPGETPPPNDGTPPKPPAPKPIGVKDKAGKTTNYDPNKEYYVNIEKGKEPVKAFVIEQKPDGKVVVQTAEGDSHEVDQDIFFAKDENAQKVKDEIDTNTSKEDIPPPTPTEDTGTKEGPMKKDLSFGLYSTTDPVYSRQDVPFDNFHRRHQNFLFDMGSSNPDVFNQDNKPKLRIIPVTSKTAQALGFPEDFIQEQPKEDNIFRSPSRYTSNDAPVISVDDVDFEKSGLEDISGFKKVRLLEIRGINAEGFPVGTVLVSIRNEDGSYGNVVLEVFFKKDAGATSNADNATIRAVYIVDDTVDPVKRRRQRASILSAIANSKVVPPQLKEQAKNNPDKFIQEAYEQARDAAGAEEQLGEKLVDKLLEYGGQGIFFVDSKGDKMGRVGEPVDPNKAIFSTFASTDLTFQASPGVSEERYTNKDNIDESAAKDWWRSTREGILSISTPEGAMQRTYQFAVSRGIPNVINKGSRNNPITVGLIRERDLDKPIITLPTLGDVAVMGAFNQEGEGIASSKQGVKMPLGTPLLNYGGNLIYLNARKFTKEETINIFEMLKIISDRNRTTESGPIFKYLHKVIYMANPEKNIAPTASSITIDKFGNLYLGTNQNPVQLLPQALEDNKERIMTFLEGAYHNIKNSELLRIQRDPKANDLEFAELKAENGRIEVVNRWKNYNYYLLSNRTPDGKLRTNEPLATNILVPQEGEKPIVQKYSEILSFDFDPSKFMRPKTVEEQRVEENPEITATDARAALAKVIADARLVGMSIDNLLSLREVYAGDDNLSDKQKSQLAGAVDTLIEHIQKKNEEQGVQQQEVREEVKPITSPEVVTTKEENTHKTLVLRKDTSMGDQLDLTDSDWRELEEAVKAAKTDADIISIIDGRTVRNLEHITFIGRPEGNDEWTDKLYNTLLSYGRENIPIPLREYLQDTHKALKSEEGIANEQETISEEPIQYIEHNFGGEVGIKKLGFRVLARDAEGNITDIDPVGTVSDDNTITPYKKPDAIKEMLMNAFAQSQIKQDDTNSEQTKTTKDKFKGRNFKRGTDRYRRAFPGNKYEKADLNAEFAEVRSMIPDYFKFKILDDMLKTTEGGLAWGALQDNMIYIYKNAEVGTTYHEAFEAVWYHFLTGKEQQDLYNEFTGRKGEFTTYNGQKRSYSKATVKEAKEQLAEEFRQYKIDEKLPEQPKQRSFFRRLLDFIKWLLGIDPSKRNEIFAKMNKGYYRNYSSSLRGPMVHPEYSYYREPALAEFSERIVQDMLQGMTADLFGDIFGENASIIDQLEEDFETTAKTIYDTMKDRFTYYFEDETADTGTLFAETGVDVEEAKSDEEINTLIAQMDSIKDIWSRIKDNWGSFVKEHERYLRIFNVEFVTDDEGNTEIVDGDDFDDENKSQSEYDRDIMTLDAKNNASNRVKLLIASVADSEWVREATRAGMTAADSVRSKRESSSLRLPKLVQYAKLFNYLLHNTAGINGIYDIWSKLTSMTEDPFTRKAVDANVRKIMSRVKLDNGFEEKTQSDARLILSLENTLTKQKPAFFRQFTDYQRNTYFKTTVLNSKVSQVKSTWIASIKGSNAIVPSAENRFLFSKAVLGTRDNVEFLNRIGIDITQADFRRLRGANVNKFNDAVNKIRSLVEKAARDKIAVPIVSSRQLDFDSRLDDLAELYVVHMVGEDTQSQHPNLENQPTSNFVLNNFVSTMVNDANNSLDREDFISRQDNEYFDDIFHKDSILLNKIIFDAQGEKNKQVQVGVVEGRETWNGDNTSTSKLTEAERLLYEINNNLNGVFYTLLPADAKTEWALNTGTYLSTDGFFGDDSSRSNEVTAFGNQMYAWLQTEIDLARDYENRKFIDALNRKPKGGGREVGKSLRFFKDIFQIIGRQDVVDDINERVIDGNAPLSEVISREQMRAFMREYAERKVQDTLKELIDWKLIHPSATDRFVLFGFDKTIVNNTLGKAYDHSRAELERLLLFREMNYVMNNIEMHKFFFGDPAQYKDELKRIKSFLSGREYAHVDMLGTSEGFNQWANEELNKAGQIQLSPGDPGYQFHKNHFNTVTAYDVIYESNEIDELREALGDRASPYTEGNEDDAGAYMSLPAYREMMWKSGGRWTSAQEKWFQWEMAWERNDKAAEGKYTYSSEELRRHDQKLLEEDLDQEVAAPILKLMHSGIQTKEGVAIVSLDKASWAPLVYRWYKEANLGKLYDAMQKRGIDYVRMESAHKVGIQKPSSFQLYNESGNLNTEAFDTMQPEMIPIKQIGVQVEQAKKDKGQTEGSQLRKIAIGDLMENGVPIDFGSSYGTPEQAFTAWNNLETVEQKVAASAIYAKVKRHNDALVNLTTIRTVLAMRRLGMEQDEDGNMTIPDKKMISDFILTELERRELPRNIASAIQISPETRDFSNPIEASPQYTKIRAIIYSILEKTITRPKVSGGQKTMLSVTGMETGPRVVKRMVNGKPVYTSERLKFYKKGENGTEACEIMLPYWFGKKLMEAGSERSKEEVIKYLNSTEEGQKLLRGIGFRIPTQGLNSVDFFTVKDFLPEQMGDVVVMPSEITAKAGSDFDIDKLNMYLRNYYIDKSGFPKSLNYKGSEQATKEYLTELIQKRSISASALRKDLERYIAEETEGFEEGGLFESLPGVGEQFENERLIQDFLANREDNVLDMYYQKTLENEYFDSIEDLLALPENYSRLIAPNDASELKSYRDRILKLKASSTAPLGDYGKLLSSTFMMKERQAYMASKQVVGISAVSQTAHAISQNIQGGLVVEDPSIVARFPHNTINGKISLSGMTTKGKDSLISNINSQTTDGGVDVAKDKFLAEQKIDKDTLSTFLTLVRMGADPWWAVLYLNQPSIQEFLKTKAISASVSQINPKVKKLADSKLLAQTHKLFGGIGKNGKNIADKPRYYAMNEMEDMITRYAQDPSSLTADQKKLQMMILDDFSRYDRSRGKYMGYSSLAWDLFHFYQGYNWDTARVNDPNLVRLKNLKFERANDLSITPARKVMEDTFIGEMRDKILQLDEGLRSIINVQTGAAGEVLNAIARDVFKMQGGEAVKQQVMLTAELSMVDYAVQTNAMVEGRPLNTLIQPLLLSPRATAIYLEALKRHIDRRLSDNPLLKALVPIVDKRPGFPSIIQLLERDYDTYTSNVLTDSFRELKDDATVISINENIEDNKAVSQVFRRLVLTALIQGGARSGRGSFSHLIPSESYSEVVRDALRNMNLTNFYDNLALYRGNWQNNTLVPSAVMLAPADPTSVEDLNAEPYYPWFYNPEVSANLARAMNISQDQVPIMLEQPAAQYRRTKVIKVQELERDKATGQILNRTIRLFRRIDVYGVNGLVPLQYSRGTVLFTEINAWGDVGIREFYNTQNQSILPHNAKVSEANDDQILYALVKSDIKTNAAEQVVADVINMFEDEGNIRDSDLDDNEPPPSEPYLQIDSFEEFKNSLQKKNCD